MNILEELWYGNICPSEQPMKKGGEYALALQQVAAEQERLSPQLQKEVEKLMDAQMNAAAIAERDAFIVGFRLAMRILVDGLVIPQ